MSRSNVMDDSFPIDVEDLFDRYVVINQSNGNRYVYTKLQFHRRIERYRTRIHEHDSYLDRLKLFLDYNTVYAANWFSTGLIYTARIRNVLPSGKIDWEVVF